LTNVAVLTSYVGDRMRKVCSDTFGDDYRKRLSIIYK